MYLIIEDNPNCNTDERVFAEKSAHKFISSIQYEPRGNSFQWWDVTGVNENGVFIPAKGVLVEDSGAGLTWLVYGGVWGLRFKPKGSNEAWDLKNKNQWGAPFKVLDSAGTDIQFA